MRHLRALLLVLILFGLFLTISRPLLPTTLPTPVCKPSNTKTDKASGYPEIQASASSGRLWALLYAPDGKFNAGTKARILWKMTDGRGDIKLTANHEDGTQIRPVWGPVSRQVTTEWNGLFSTVLRQLRTDWEGLPSMISRQARTDWKHPGQEWGSEFIFPKAGCWRILVSRWLIDSDKAITGEIAIEVKP